MLRLRRVGPRRGFQRQMPNCKNWSLWFANLNTPGEFAEAKQHVDALDT